MPWSFKAGGALGLFEYLSEPVVEDVSSSNIIRRAFESLLAEIAEPGSACRRRPRR